MTDINKTAVIILAAGKSSRFGSQKQLADWQGITLIENAIKIVTEANFKNIFVSLDPSHSKIREKIISYPIEIIYCKNANAGLGNTISDSIKKIITMGEKYESCLILLSDQPFIPYQHLIKLTENNKKGECTFTKYENTVGTPAVFSSQYFSKLKLLKGDSGAKSLSKELKPKFELYNSEFIDIDHQEDYQKLILKMDVTI
jgi:molybdenum cofactor cytidylyltransferase